MKYAFVKKYSRKIAVITLCTTVGVSSSGYYRWLKEPIGKRDRKDSVLDQKILNIFYEHKRRYGATRIHKDLKDNGYKVTQNKVSQRMKILGLTAKARMKYKATTDSNHSKQVAPNLLNQNFTATNMNQKWLTDITYIPTQEGWLYLCVIIDLFSRSVIGWSMDKRMKADLVCGALNMALFRRNFPEDVIVHSDRGSQYCSNDFKRIIEKNNLKASMSGKGCCYDNAACESFFGTLKVELTHDEKYQTRQQAQTSIFEYIETYYNTKRRHSSINYMIPRDFEAIMENEFNNCPKLAG